MGGRDPQDRWQVAAEFVWDDSIVRPSAMVAAIRLPPNAFAAVSETGGSASRRLGVRKTTVKSLTALQRPWRRRAESKRRTGLCRDENARRGGSRRYELPGHSPYASSAGHADLWRMWHPGGMGTVSTGPSRGRRRRARTRSAAESRSGPDGRQQPVATMGLAGQSGRLGCHRAIPVPAVYWGTPLVLGVNRRDSSGAHSSRFNATVGPPGAAIRRALPSSCGVRGR
jgi:hypothetical protein